MDETALRILAAAAASETGTVGWTGRGCRCVQLTVGTMTMYLVDVDLTRSAINHLLSMGLLEVEGDHYRITEAGNVFVKIYKLFDREEG